MALFMVKLYMLEKGERKKKGNQHRLTNYCVPIPCARYLEYIIILNLHTYEAKIKIIPLISDRDRF